jgi:hypothetical protein
MCLESVHRRSIAILHQMVQAKAEKLRKIKRGLHHLVQCVLHLPDKRQQRSLPGPSASRTSSNRSASAPAGIALDARKLGKFSLILADPPWDDEFGASIARHHGF